MTSADRRAALARAARLRQLPEIDREIIALANDSKFGRWLEQIRAAGGCAHPVHLTGSTTTRDAATGEVLHHYDTSGEPGERLLIRCRNRRVTVCAPCARLHAGDTFHLVRAGLLGGKTIPTTVRERPRLFATLTAPSFGPVHHVTGGRRCHPRRGGGSCEHGRPVGCGLVHAETDPLVGQPLCPGCYDYPAHVLWHAHAGRLWKAFTDNLYNHLAAETGTTRTELRRAVRVSYAKVAEYQKRAAVHVHAVVRLDGPTGPGDPPPAWGTAELLETVVRTAARAVDLATPYSRALGVYPLRWGSQLDTRPLRAFGTGEGLADDAVAAYVAKYVSKGADDTGAGRDHRITDPAGIDHAPLSAHVRALMYTCWRLGGLPELEPLRLRAWAHTLGYRGHILTKSHRYSTTYGALRAERAEHQRGPDLANDTGTVTDSNWRYVASGHTPGAALLAAGIAEDLQLARDLARDHLAPGWAGGARRAPQSAEPGARGPAMEPEPAGCASAHALGHGLAAWRIDTAFDDVASAVARLLGGVPVHGAGGRWNVVTASSVLRVEITSAADTALRFRLAQGTALGELDLRLAPWTVAEVLGDRAAALGGLSSGMVACDLAARVVDFTTKGGRIVRYAVPSLVRRA